MEQPITKKNIRVFIKITNKTLCTRNELLLNFKRKFETLHPTLDGNHIPTKKSDD